MAADLLAGDQDPRSGAAGLLRRALASLPRGVRRVALRADAGYFAADLAVAAHREGVGFAIGAKRIAPLWRLLDGIAASDWTDATAMEGAQVAIADYRPAWWPTNTHLLIRRVALDPSQVSADPGPGAGAPCTPTSAPCPCPSWPRPRRCMATLSS